MTNAVVDLRVKCDRTMCIAGPSHSGKTHLALQIIDNRESFFDCAIGRVVWCYGIYQSALHVALEKRGVESYSGSITTNDIQPFDLIVLDDLLDETRSSNDVTAMFTKAAHHKPCFIIFITQNLFPGGKEARTRSLNTHYYVLFKNPRDKSQIEFLARQISPRKSKALIDVFEEATKPPHGYLFCDFTQECAENYRFRSNLFRDVDAEQPIIIYKIH